MELWEKILLAEEQGRAQARERSSAPPTVRPLVSTPGNKKRLSPVVSHKRNIAVSRIYKAVELTGKGLLREGVVVADTAMELFLEVDGRDLFAEHSSWADLTALALYSESITATARGGSYVLSITKIAFERSLRLHVKFPDTATISSLFCMYEVDS